MTMISPASSNGAPRLAHKCPAPIVPQLSQPPLFSSSWSLDAVAPGAWGEVTIVKNHRLRARIAFGTRHYRFVGDALVKPPLTPYLGPELYELERIGSRQLAEQHMLMELLIDRLPKHARFLQ